MTDGNKKQKTTILQPNLFTTYCTLMQIFIIDFSSNHTIDKLKFNITLRFIFRISLNLGALCVINVLKLT